jgi:spore germination protein GerM
MAVTTRIAAAVVTVSVTALMAGCGVSIQQAPHPVEIPGLAGTPVSGPTQTPQGSVTETLYLVKDGHLMAVGRSVPQQPSPSQHLSDLLAGPAVTEQQQGLSSALAGTDLRLAVQVRDGQATVELATSLEGTGRTDDILAFAQIVCTLDSREDVETVSFTRAGEPVEVPRADGALTSQPLTSGDYANLVIVQESVQ